MILLLDSDPERMVTVASGLTETGQPVLGVDRAETAALLMDRAGCALVILTDMVAGWRRFLGDDSADAAPVLLLTDNPGSHEAHGAAAAMGAGIATGAVLQMARALLTGEGEMRILPVARPAGDSVQKGGQNGALKDITPVDDYASPGARPAARFHRAAERAVEYDTPAAPLVEAPAETLTAPMADPGFETEPGDASKNIAPKEAAFSGILTNPALPEPGEGEEGPVAAWGSLARVPGIISARQAEEAAEAERRAAEEAAAEEERRAAEEAARAAEEARRIEEAAEAAAREAAEFAAQYQRSAAPAPAEPAPAAPAPAAPQPAAAPLDAPQYEPAAQYAPAAQPETQPELLPEVAENGDAFRHLDDGEQAVETGQRAGAHRHPEHGHGRLRREHAGQMRRAARAGDDRAQSARPRGLGIGEETIRRAMRRDDPRLMGHGERLEDRRRRAQGRPIGLTAHDHADSGRRGAGESVGHLSVSRDGAPLRRLCDDVRIDLVLEQLDPVFEQQLPLFQALKFQGRGAAAGAQRGHLLIQARMLRHQRLKRRAPDFLRIHDFHRSMTFIDPQPCWAAASIPIPTRPARRRRCANAGSRMPHRATYIPAD